MATRTQRNIRSLCDFAEGIVIWFGLLGLLMIALVVRFWIESLVSR